MTTHTCSCEEMAKKAREEEEKLYRELDKIIEKHKEIRGLLIQTLHAAQELLGCLPERAQVRIAKGLGIPLSEVHGVLSFYSFFNTAPRGRHNTLFAYAWARPVTSVARSKRLKSSNDLKTRFRPQPPVEDRKLHGRLFLTS